MKLDGLYNESFPVFMNITEIKLETYNANHAMKFKKKLS